MKKEYLKIGILGILIVGCIAQTMMLWLGGMLSHNFLAQTQISERVIKPTEVWLLSPTSVGQGSTSALAYPISQTKEETQVEYERLIIELQALLKQIPQDVEVEYKTDIDWEALMGVSGIVYEYSIPVSIDEMIGISKQPNSLEHATQIHTIILQMNTKLRQELTLHFIDEVNHQVFTLGIPGTFDEFSKIYEYALKREQHMEASRYQPSAISNMNRYIKGNAFMPIASAAAPIPYTVLTARNGISSNQEIALSQLEHYVDSFFINPLTKDVEIREDGTILFKENKKGFVIYNPVGKLEYVNLAPKIQGESDVLTSYNTAVAFLEATTAITDEVKAQLYLTKIDKDGETYHCYFDRSYEGYTLDFDSAFEEVLGMEAFVQITIKGDQVIGAKMSLIEIEPHDKAGDIQVEQLKSEYIDPINKGLEQISPTDYGSIVFEDSKAMYVIENLETSIHLKRGVLFDEKWYYLE